uniref:Uncharacterized protein n=1 Tax=Rhizophora mucronata TaxID=61149 RepID=A0A2P2QVX6_RHIMU
MLFYMWSDRSLVQNLSSICKLPFKVVLHG